MQQKEIGSFILTQPFFKKNALSTLGINILDLLFYNGSIDCFCPKCGDHSIFVGENDDPYRSQLKITMSLGLDAPRTTKRERNLSGIYLLDFYCPRNREHKLNFILKVDEQNVIKIGQSPSALDILQGDFKQYKSLLGSSFSDLYSAVILHSNNFGVASFTHLRRLMENFFIVEVLKAWEQNNPALPELTFSDMRFRDKINLLKDYLPDTFTENPNLYSITSSGIHGLTEEECLGYFTPLKNCILLCLDEMLSDIKKKAMKEGVKKSLGQIASSINRLK